MPIATKAIIYHNTQCSKSNAVLNLLLEHGIETRIIHYLETPLSCVMLKNLLNELDMEAKAIIRFGEPVAKELELAIDDIRDEQEWLSMLVQHPVLIERPIVSINKKAVIARPPGRLLDLIRANK